MASASTSSTRPLVNNDNDANTGNESKSYFRKTVCLHDWWLINAEHEYEGKRLGVAGFTSREQQAMRVFVSAPISRRYDVFTLETIDGICVIVKGLINKVRTEENGFPSEVFNHFVFGFPPHWEEYAAEIVARSNRGLGKFSMCSGTVTGEGDSYEGTPKNNEKGITEERHDDRGRESGAVEDNESPVGVRKVWPSHVLSGNIVGGASKDLTLQNQGFASLTSAEVEHRADTCSGVSNIDVGSTVERFSSASKDEGHLSFTAGLVNNDTCNMVNSSLSTNPASNDVNSLDVNITVELEAPSHRVLRSGKKVNLQKNERKVKKGTHGNPKGNNLENVKNLNDNTKMDNTMMESPLPGTSDVNNANSLKVSEDVIAETSSMNARSFKRLEDSKLYGKDVGIERGSINFSAVSLLQHPEMAVGCVDEGVISVNNSKLSNIAAGGIENESLSGAPVVESTNTEGAAGNCPDDIARQHIGLYGSERNIVSPFIKNMYANATPNNDKTGRSYKLRNLRDHQKENPVSNWFLKYRSRKCNSPSGAPKNLGEEKLNTKSITKNFVFGEEKDILAKTRRNSEGKMLRTCLSKSKLKQVDSQTTNCLLYNHKNKSSSVSMGSSEEVKYSVPDGDRDSGGGNDFKTAAVKKKSNSKGASKAKRKLEYVTPITRKGKREASIVTPESFKRSRSGSSSHWN
ncbi:unnamed protein product [Ilex paraguariensis]|uniref:SANTA domain-containing protein n=1 Tax=Ilex paraguariensis TaxID=185542 RepID=A0ABC8V486_9AQUA